MYRLRKKIVQKVTLLQRNREKAQRGKGKEREVSTGCISIETFGKGETEEELNGSYTLRLEA